MDVRSSHVAQLYQNARPATQPGARAEAQGTAGDAFARVARDFADTVRQGEEAAKSAMTGDADPYALVQALAATELAVETAVTVRDKVVEAYQEILRMPV
ncbi:MAG: flagellar hook-basal body complex protein FliE [Paracoccaceae bacterium]|nr:flagellar hook-basal body complex protein FliE [Paracoccaceae bacterium]